jgi:DNA ligase-1
MQELKLTQQFVDESNATNSNSDKLAVIEKYANQPDVLKVLQYTYDTFKQYGVTSANCKKRSDLILPFTPYSNIFDLLDALANRDLTGYDAIETVNGFVEENKVYADLIWNIIDRNLKTRSTVSMINKAIPGLIPTFDVALAKAYDEKTQKKVNWEDGWFVSRKLDGVRCITIIDMFGEVKFFSRQGKEFLTLDNLKKDIKALGLTNTVLDGEVCIVDENGNEDFAGIIKEIKRKDHTIEKPFYWMFDMLDLEDFNDKTSQDTFSMRISKLLNLTFEKPNELIGVLYQERCTDHIFSEMMAKSKANGWEGLMLRKDTQYKGKRSDDILKVKQMFDDEYIVVDLENDYHRVIVGGQEVEEMMLKNVIIEHKGNRVQVGSGFSHEQRRHYFENPDEILGKQITVQYFEETTNKNGTHSLRFPVIKAVYENMRTF